MLQQAEDRKPLRILHVVYHLEGGGVSRWLNNVIQHVDRLELSMDVVRHADAGSDYNLELEKNGARVFSVPSPRSPLRHARAFIQILRANGPYDVVHSHMNNASGLILRLARLGGVPVRIATCHNPVSMRELRGIEGAYHWLMNRWLKKDLTTGMGVSEPAARFTH